MNEFRFCGRALETPELLESEKGSKYAHLFLKVEREYKNSDGKVDTDVFRITCLQRSCPHSQLWPLLQIHRHCLSYTVFQSPCP